MNTDRRISWDQSDITVSPSASIRVHLRFHFRRISVSRVPAPAGDLRGEFRLSVSVLTVTVKRGVDALWGEREGVDADAGGVGDGGVQGGGGGDDRRLADPFDAERAVLALHLQVLRSDQRRVHRGRN